MKNEHFQKYQSLAEKIGIERLAVLVPQPERVRDCLTKDEHLNNIPLHLWDAQHDAVRELAKKYARVPGWSIADSVCVLKHVARYYVAENPALSVPQPMTMDRFIEQSGIAFELFHRDSNPNMDSPNMFHYTARLVRQGVVLETPFSTGTGWTRKPELRDVLDCLASDASCLESSPDFESFCADLGYDSDSRKAERIYNECKRIQGRLRDLLGSELYNVLVFETERL